MTAEIEEAIARLDVLKERLAHERSLDNARIRQALELEYSYESNRIEGNTLTLRETDLVINEGLTISGKPLKDHLEAINHRDALEFVKELALEDAPLSERDALQVHSLVLQGIDRENAGRYRSVPVLIKGSAFVPPQPVLLPELMEGFYEWISKESIHLHPIIKASEVHQRLVTIHPFIDGNGRTARLLMNLILLRNGYPLAILKGDADSRLRYYEALEAAQTTGDKTEFHLLICHTLEATFTRLLGLL